MCHNRKGICDGAVFLAGRARTAPWRRGLPPARRMGTVRRRMPSREQHGYGHRDGKVWVKSR